MAEARVAADRFRMLVDHMTDGRVAADRLRMLVENMTDVTHLSTTDGHLVWTSSSVTELLGWTPAEMVGRRVADFLHPDDRDEFQRRAALLPAGEPAGWEARVLSRSGEFRWLSMRVSPVIDDAGDVAGFVTACRDIQDEHEARVALQESQDRFRAALASELDPHIFLDAIRDSDGSIVDFGYSDANEAALRYLGLSLEELTAATLLSLAPNQRDSGLFDMYTRTVEQGEDIVLDAAPVFSEILGRKAWLDFRGVRSGDGLSLTWRDVTERVRAEAEHDLHLRVAASEAHYRLLAENATDVVAQLRDGVFVWVSPSVREALGWEPDDWVGGTTSEFIHPDDREVLNRDLRGLDHGATVVHRIRIRAKSGGYHWVEARTRTFLDGTGRPDGQITSMRIIDAEVEAQQELQAKATRDDLTGLLTRGEILDRLTTILSHRARAGRRVAVAFADIDDFKAVNDRHGHGAGDEALRILGERIRAAVRENDLVARFGGDEILVVIDAVRNEADALVVAEKMRAAALLPIPIPGGTFAVTLSIGLTLATPGDAIDGLIARADAAMYDAKATGKNQVVTITALGA